MGGAVAATVALRGRGLARSLTLISPLGLGEEINTRYIDGFVAAESRRELKPVLKDLFADENLVIVAVGPVGHRAGILHGRASFTYFE